MDAKEIINALVDNADYSEIRALKTVLLRIQATKEQDLRGIAAHLKTVESALSLAEMPAEVAEPER